MICKTYADVKALSKAAADLFLQTSQEAISKQGRFSVALSGGSTPQLMHELLAQPPYRETIQWENVHVFWGDERCVPPADPRNNATAAFDALLSLVPIPVEQIHPMSGVLPPAESAAEYAITLNTYFNNHHPRFDLVFLGMGDDGHTASLFPGTDVLEEKQAMVKSLFLAKQDMYRVTLTAPAINLAAKVVFLIAGGGKANVLKQVIEGDFDPTTLPSQLIKPSNGELYWLLDEAAGAQLQQRKQ